MLRLRLLAAPAAGLLFLTCLPPAEARADEAGCNVDIARTSARLVFSHLSALNRCIKFGNYNDCAVSDNHIERSEAKLRARISAPNGKCAAAVNGDGVPLSRFGPLSCPDAGASCDAAVPFIADLDDLADCLVCVHAGQSAVYRARLDLPDEVPGSSNEAKCVRSVVSTTAKAMRTGGKEVARCGKGGIQPFDCPADDGLDTRFAKDLEKIIAKIAKCRDADGQQGSLSGASAGLCGGLASTPLGLRVCTQSIARCMVCQNANAIFNQSQDCLVYSGIDCSELAP